MTTHTATQPVVQRTSSERIEALEKAVADLTAKLEALTAPKNASTKEMTDDDARRVLYGDLKDAKHKDAAAKLGLTYGQVYSCRLEFTFKNIHKEMKDKKIANSWKK